MSLGRPSLFDPKYCEQARKLCLLGATDEEMAGIFGVVPQTFYDWQKVHPDFLESITRGKEQADADVASRLYERAMGYSHPEVHVSSYEGEITLTPLTKHYPPDTQAASLWLRNRQPKRWRDRHEHTGADGGPIETKDVTHLDAGRRLAFLLTQAVADAPPEPQDPQA